MSKRSDRAKQLRTTKTIFMVIMIFLTVFYLLILIISKDFRSHILEDSYYLCAFIITLLCLVLSFISLMMDFVLLKKRSQITRDLRDMAFLDKLTGLPNRYSIDRISQKYDTPERLKNLGCVLLVIKNLKEINEKSGRSGGDKVISEFCAILESVGTQYGLIGRNSGNEFLVIIEECDKNTLLSFTDALKNMIHNHNTISPNLPIALAYSAVLESDIKTDHFYALITQAYKQFEDAPAEL